MSACPLLPVSPPSYTAILMADPKPGVYVRHESSARKERSTCGWRYRLISEGDENVNAWAHTVDLDGSKAHVHHSKGKLKVLVVGVPDIDDKDLYFPEEKEELLP